MRVTILYKNYDEWVAKARLLIARSLNELGKKEEAQKVLDDVL